MLRLPASGLDEARLPAPLGRRRVPRAPRPAAVLQAEASGGSGGEVQKLHAFLSASAPHQQQQQGLSSTDAYQGALPPPMVEDWSRLRVRRHMRLRRIEVDLPPALAQQLEEQQREPQQLEEQQREPQQAQAQAQTSGHTSEAAVQQQVAAAQQAPEPLPVQAAVVAPAAEAVAAAPAVPAAEQLPVPVAVQEQAAVQAAAPLQQAQAQQAQAQQVVQQRAEQQQGFALPQVDAEQLSSMASGAAGRVARLAQQTQVAAQGAATEAAALGQQQLASLQQLTAHQIGNLQQAAGHARQQLAAGASRLQAKVQPQQTRQAPVVQQTAASSAVEDSVQTAAAASQAHAPQAAAVQQQQQQQQEQQVVAQAPQGRQVHRAAAAAVAVPPPPPLPLPWQQAAVPSSPGQWLLAALAAATVLAVPALRWLRGQRRQRSPQDEIREAEQRARAARLYDRQRQRFQRALLAAEDLEGADSSVFNAVSRKGSVSAAAPAAGAAAAGGHAAAPAGGAAGTGAAVLPPAAEAAVAEFVGPVHSMTSMDADDDGYAADGSTDVFDPASWDDETRKQWEAFVSSSKVNKGKLWDTNQVDEGLPAVWVDLNK